MIFYFSKQNLLCPKFSSRKIVFKSCKGKNRICFCFYSFFPMTIIVFPQTRHVPLIAGLPFFNVVLVGFCISRFALHFTQNPSTILFSPHLLCIQDIFKTHKLVAGKLIMFWLFFSDIVEDPSLFMWSTLFRYELTLLLSKKNKTTTRKIKWNSFFNTSIKCK